MVYWHILVTIGQWAQTHQELVLAISVTVVLVLGASRVPWRSAFHGRRPRL
jgi:hypothetical protein